MILGSAAHLTILLLIPSMAPGFVESASVRDDLGKEVPAPITACAGGTAGPLCWTLNSDSMPVGLKPSDDLSLEGPAHGPLTIKYSDLVALQASTKAIVLTRKARLRVQTTLKEPVTASFFDPQDRELRKPRHRWVVTDAEQRFPAGSWIVALSATRTAPEIQFVDAAPAALVTLAKSDREGWSAVLFAKDTEGTPVSASAVISDAEHSPDEVSRAGKSRNVPLSGGRGFANGISTRTARIDVQAPGFISARLGAVTAAQADFAVRVVTLQKGGRLDLTVTEDGAPARNARWRLLVPAARPERDLRLKVQAEGITDKDGRAERRGLTAGSYILRVSPSGSKNSTDERVTIENDLPLERTIELVSIPIDGEVLRGGKALRGAEVRISLMYSGESPDDEADTVAKTDENGFYSTKVYAEGQYRFIVSADGTPAARRQYWMPRSGKRVDFELLDGTLRGTVLDDDGAAIRDAAVALKDSAQLFRLARTDAQGRFEFLFEASGKASVFADKDGYERSKPMDIEIPATSSLDPVSIVLKKYPSIRGRVERSAGQPASGVSVATMDQNGNPLQGTTTDADGLFQLRATPGTTRLYFSGPSCPLGWREALGSGAPYNSDEGERFVIRCSHSGAALSLTLQTEDQGPVAGEALRLRQNGRVVPDEILVRHQQRLGLGTASDASGRLEFVSLEEGAWDLFLARSSSPVSIMSGQPNGFLLSEGLRPGDVSELVVTVRSATTRISP